MNRAIIRDSAGCGPVGGSERPRRNLSQADLPLGREAMGLRGTTSPLENEGLENKSSSSRVRPAVSIPVPYPGQYSGMGLFKSNGLMFVKMFPF